jgi:hypothetical protein
VTFCRGRQADCLAYDGRRPASMPAMTTTAAALVHFRGSTAP